MKLERCPRRAKKVSIVPPLFFLGRKAQAGTRSGPAASFLIVGWQGLPRTFKLQGGRSPQVVNRGGGNVRQGRLCALEPAKAKGKWNTGRVQCTSRGGKNKGGGGVAP